MEKMIYHYDKAGRYIGSSISKKSPLDAKQGRDVWLIPAQATETPPPEIPPNKKAIWKNKNKAWHLEDIYENYISILTKNRFIEDKFMQEILAEFPNVEIERIENAEKHNWEKKITIRNIEATPKNIKSIYNLINNHKYEMHKIQKIREERDKKLSNSNWLITRHIEEKILIENGVINSTTLKENQFLKLLIYRNKLRKLLENIDIDNINWPELDLS